MSLAISAVFVSGFQKVFACKETSHFKVSNLINDEISLYRSPFCFSEEL